MDLRPADSDRYYRWQVADNERTERLAAQQQGKQRRLQSMLPLPQRALPHPWEDLSSLLSRIARKMGYEHPEWLLHPESAPHRINPAGLSLLHWRDDYLLLLDEEQTYALTLHRFAPRFSEKPLPLPNLDPGAQQSITRAGLSRERGRQFFLTGQHTQVCPQCLDEAPAYDRLYWRCSLLLYCPRHLVFLVQSCPSCRAPIPALRPSLTRCPSCKAADYRAASFPLLSEDRWLVSGHTTLIRHLGIEPAIGPSPVATEGTALDGLSPWDYFQLLAFCSSFLKPVALVGEGIFRSFTDKLPPGAIAERLSQRTRISPHALIPPLFTHYFSSAWPLHILAHIDHLGRLLQEGFHYSGESRVVQTWFQAMVQGNYWCVRAYIERPVDHLRDFLRLYRESFEFLPTAEVAEDRHGGAIVNERLLLVKTTHITPLEKAILPHQWESLLSLLARAAAAMGYRRTEGIWRALNDPSRLSLGPDRVLFLERDGDYQFFKELLLLDETTLYALTLHRFTPPLQPPQPEADSSKQSSLWKRIERPLLAEETAERFCLPPRITKVCPACLQEEPGYERLYWNMRTLLICPRHRLFLIGRCPNCGWLIPSLRRTELCECPYCSHGDYRAAKSMGLEGDELLFRSQLVLLRKLGVDELGWQDTSLSFHDSPIEALEPWQYFDLLYRFGPVFPALLPERQLSTLSGINGQPGGWVSHERTVGARRAAMQVSLFHALFLSWPAQPRTVLGGALLPVPTLLEGGDPPGPNEPAERVYAWLRNLFSKLRDVSSQRTLQRNWQLADGYARKQGGPCANASGPGPRRAFFLK